MLYIAGGTTHTHTHTHTHTRTGETMTFGENVGVKGREFNKRLLLVNEEISDPGLGDSQIPTAFKRNESENTKTLQLAWE